MLMWVKAHMWKLFLLLILYCTMQWQLYQVIYPKVMEGVKDIYNKCYTLSLTKQSIQIVLHEEDTEGRSLRDTNKSLHSWTKKRSYVGKYHNSSKGLKTKQIHVREKSLKLPQTYTQNSKYPTKSNADGYEVSTSSEKTQTAQPRDGEFLVAGYNYVTAGNCSGDACSLNLARKPEKLGLRLLHGVNCSIQNCTTAIVKSKNGLKSLRILVASAQRIYPGLKFVIIDDFNAENLKRFTERPLGGIDQVLYVQVPSNVGVGYGRNIALQLVQTKYFIYLDDDFCFRNETSLHKMLSLLEESDITLVAGKVTCCGGRFEGVLRMASRWNPVGRKKTETYVYHFPGVAYSSISGYNHCYRVDITKNFFMAKKHDVILAGGWDSDRKLFEHEDFFMRLRKARAKIAYCEDVAIDHVPSTERSSWKERIPFFAKYNAMFKRKWQVNGFQTCQKKTSYVSDQENLVCSLKELNTGSVRASPSANGILCCQFVLLVIFMINSYENVKCSIWDN